MSPISSRPPAQRPAGPRPPAQRPKPKAKARAAGPQAKPKAPVKPQAGQKPAGAKPQAAAGPGGLFGAAKRGFQQIQEQVQGGLKKVNERLNPPLTPKQKEAAELMHGMLEPDKLGGNDRTFNHQDVDAVVKGLTDGGLKGVIAKRVVAGQLPKGLDEAGVVKDPKAKPDTAKRAVGTDELRAFQKAGEIMESRGEDLKKLGLKATFPGGISQDAISHMLEGRFGLPPGVQIVPAEPWPAQ